MIAPPDGACLYVKISYSSGSFAHHVDIYICPRYLAMRAGIQYISHLSYSKEFYHPSNRPYHFNTESTPPTLLLRYEYEGRGIKEEEKSKFGIYNRRLQSPTTDNISK